MVSASRAAKDQFEKDSLLGKSLGHWRIQFPIELSLYLENQTGLPFLYNYEIERALKEGDDDLILVFIHDDVTLLDFFWPDTLSKWTRTFDIVGLAGNVRRTPLQPTWGHILNESGNFEPDQEVNLCGAVSTGLSFPSLIGYYGAPGRECRLMDGLFLAARTEIFRRFGLRFDVGFPFHFYDLDLCRQAELLGIRMGVAPIPALHASAGNYGGGAWLEGYRNYLAKWGE
jgi:GT2 family glycosyltransferase